MCLVSIHSRVWESFSLYFWSAVIPKHEKILFSEKINIFFQGRFFCFSGLELESVPGSPYIKYTWCGRLMEMPPLLYVSKQFCHQEIRWNYGILHTLTSYSLEYYGSFVQVRNVRTSPPAIDWYIISWVLKKKFLAGPPELYDNVHFLQKALKMYIF